VDRRNSGPKIPAGFARIVLLALRFRRIYRKAVIISGDFSVFVWPSPFRVVTA